MDNPIYVAELTPDALDMIEARLQNERKSLVLAYVFWLCLGTFGAHHWYLGRKRWAILYTSCVILMTVSVLFRGATNTMGFDTASVTSILSAIPILIVSFGLLLDLFWMPRYTREAIEKKRSELIEQYRQNGYV